jgi:hypothetical protein
MVTDVQAPAPRSKVQSSFVLPRRPSSWPCPEEHLAVEAVQPGPDAGGGGVGLFAVAQLGPGHAVEVQGPEIPEEGAGERALVAAAVDVERALVGGDRRGVEQALAGARVLLEQGPGLGGEVKAPQVRERGEARAVRGAVAAVQEELAPGGDHDVVCAFSGAGLGE